MHHQQLWSGQAEVPQCYLVAHWDDYFSTILLLRQHSPQAPITSMCYNDGRLIWIRICLD